MDQSAMSEAECEIEKLLGLHPKGFDLSLDRITRLLGVLGNDVHGTNAFVILAAPFRASARQTQTY